MYKAIIFDLDNTLLNYNLSELTSMKQALEDHKLTNELVWEDFWATFAPINFAYWMDRIQHKYSIYEVLEYSFTDTFRRMNKDYGIAKEITRTYWNLFCGTCDLEPGADRMLNGLHGKYALGIISNGIGEAQRKRLQAGNLGHYFSTLVVSDEVGFWKPDKQIFEHAFNELSVSRDEVLFIGDSLQDDYLGATNIGIDFCYYNPKLQKLDERYKPNYMVKELSEIPLLLEELQGRKDVREA